MCELNLYYKCNRFYVKRFHMKIVVLNPDLKTMIRQITRENIVTLTYLRRIGDSKNMALRHF